MSRPLDCIIGDGLVDSPYMEMKKLAELWEENYYKLYDLYMDMMERQEMLLDKVYGPDTRM